MRSAPTSKLRPGANGSAPSSGSRSPTKAGAPVFSLRRSSSRMWSPCVCVSRMYFTRSFFSAMSASISVQSAPVSKATASRLAGSQARYEFTVMSSKGVLNCASPSSATGSGYQPRLPVSASASAPSPSTGATARAVVSSHAPSRSDCTSPVLTPARAATSLSASFRPRMALPTMSLKKSSSGMEVVFINQVSGIASGTAVDCGAGATRRMQIKATTRIAALAKNEVRA